MFLHVLTYRWMDMARERTFPGTSFHGIAGWGLVMPSAAGTIQVFGKTRVNESTDCDWVLIIPEVWFVARSLNRENRKHV